MNDTDLSLFLQDLNACGSEALTALQSGDLDACGRDIKALLDSIREKLEELEP